MSRLERDYQPKLMKRITSMFPGCVVVKNDANYLQGILDWTIFYKNRYALLEVKKSEKEKPQPNQPYYAALFGQMAFAAFIYPENEVDVLEALAKYFGEAE